MMKSDMELVREYATRQSESAFETLVSRHLSLVSSSALRQVRDPHLAEEIAQAVFIILAQKAHSLNSKTILPGWLYRTTRFTASKAMQKQFRRQVREQDVYMESTNPETSTETIWQEISPLLDDTMQRLKQSDRYALVLRYLENKSLQEVGAALGVEERAAQKRIARGLDKLRALFARRGIVLTSFVIAGAMSAHSASAVPVGLPVTISATAVSGTSAATSVTMLVKGTLQMITKIKIKFALVTTAAAILTVGAVTVALSENSKADSTSVREIVDRCEAAYAAMDSYSDDGTVICSGGGESTTTSFNIRLQRPAQYRVNWNQTGGFYNSAGIAWSDGKEHFFVNGRAGEERKATPEKRRDMQFCLGTAGGVSSSAASILPPVFFQQGWGDLVHLAGYANLKTKNAGDEKVGDINCFVIAYTLDPIKLPKGEGSTGKVTTRLWIGKHDYLIHKVQTISENATLPLPRLSDEVVKNALAEKNQAATPAAISAKRVELEAAIKKGMKDTTFVFTQTHENISVNAKFSATDFEQ